MSKSLPSNVEQIVIANREVVERLTQHLLDAYNEFLAEQNVDFKDGFMAAHNFHKWIVLDLEERTGDDVGALRKVAIDTFELALKPKGH